MPKGLKGFQKGNKIALGNKNSLGKIPWNKGIPRTKEEKLKISLSKIGKKFTSEQKERMKFGQHNIGRKQSPETIEKRVSKMRGENNPHWKGGISNDPYPKEFNLELKIKIRRRDGFTCCLCGRTEREELEELNRVLCVNHIDFNKSNCNEDNLNTLCMRCNIKINREREYWTDYFNQQ